MDAFVTNISAKPLAWWMKMDRLITGASLKGTYQIRVPFCKTQEVGVKRKHLKRRQGVSLDHFGSSMVKSLLCIIYSVEDAFLVYPNLLQNFCFPAQS